MSAVEFVERPWAELVFHVLAHVRCSHPSSVYQPRYVAWVERHLGPSSGRELAECLVALEGAAASHDGMIGLNRVAWLFDDVSGALAVADRDLCALELADRRRTDLVRALLPDSVGAEVLRAAALLESERLAALPAVHRDDRLGSLIGTLGGIAPELGCCRFACLRPLGRRGRVLDREIWLGTPSGELGAPVELVAWQAAHEATVGELARGGLSAGERDLERAALYVMRERARGAGCGSEHAAWLGEGAGNVPRRSDLSGDVGVFVDRALDAGG